MHEIDVELPSQGCKYCTVKEKQSCWGCCTGTVGLMGLKDNWRWSTRSELKTSAGHDKFLVWPWEWTAEVSTEGTDIKELSSQRTERILFLDVETIQNYSRREWQWTRSGRLQVMLRRDSHSSRWLTARSGRRRYSPMSAGFQTGKAYGLERTKKRARTSIPLLGLMVWPRLGEKMATTTESWRQK